MLGIVRSATTDPVAAAMLRRIVSEGPVLTLAAALDRPDATLRATLAGSQLVGLIMVRYVIGVEPLASAAEDVLVRTLGATIQHYLTGDGRPWDPAGHRGDAARLGHRRRPP